MNLKTKTDFNDVKKRWTAFWNNEFIERPMICATIPKNENLKQVELSKTLRGRRNVGRNRYYQLAAFMV